MARNLLKVKANLKLALFVLISGSILGMMGKNRTTLAAMQEGNYKNSFKQHEPNITGIGTDLLLPSVNEHYLFRQNMAMYCGIVSAMWMMKLLPRYSDVGD